MFHGCSVCQGGTCRPAHIAGGTSSFQLVGQWRDSALTPPGRSGLLDIVQCLRPSQNNIEVKRTTLLKHHTSAAPNRSVSASSRARASPFLSHETKLINQPGQCSSKFAEGCLSNESVMYMDQNRNSHSN